VATGRHEGRGRRGRHGGDPRNDTGRLLPAAAAGYEPITTVEQAQVLANYLGEYGDYPVGLSPCFAAGINGDAGDACPFAGEDFCTCDTED
jgi:hypothetical protein